VVERTATETQSTQEWAFDEIFDNGEGLVITGAAGHHDPADVAGTVAECSPQEWADDEILNSRDDFDTEAGAAADPVALDDDESAAQPRRADVNAGAKRTLMWLASGVVVLAVVIVLVFLVFGGGPTPTPPPAHKSAATPAVVAVPTTPNLPAPPQDQAVPYSPQTDSCPGGPTSPLSLTDPTSDTAWVCSRGPQESRLDGQVLHVKFVCDRSRPDSTCSYMLNSVSITPGWVAKTVGGKDEWLQHRVVTRLQFNFYNGDQLAADPFIMDTNSVHGPVPATLPGKILVSRVDVIILHTERPPAAPAPGATPGAVPGDGVTPPPGLVDSVLGSGDPAAPAATAPDPYGATSAATSDQVDATFAVSQLQFFGHAPN
jgi:hypothetical protein